MLGRPGFGWRALRKNSPGKYEAGADIQPSKWFHVRLEIANGNLAAYVNDDSAPVFSGKLLSERESGRLGVWGWDSYFANFRFTPAE